MNFFFKPGLSDRENEFNKIFQAEILANFNAQSFFLDKITYRHLAGSGSQRFVRFGSAQHRKHSPGEEYISDPLLQSNIAISADQSVYASFEFPKEDVLQLDETFRFQVTEELSRALAKYFDEQIFVCIVKGARKNKIGNISGGKQLSVTSEQDIVSGIKGIRTHADAQGIPSGELTCVLNEKSYETAMTQDTASSMSDGALNCMGLHIFVSNLLASEKLDGVDLSKTLCVAFHKKSVGAVISQRLKLSKYEDLNKGSWVYRAEMVFGTSELRPESIVEIKKQ